MYVLLVGCTLTAVFYLGVGVSRTWTSVVQTVRLSSQVLTHTRVGRQDWTPSMGLSSRVGPGWVQFLDVGKFPSPTMLLPTTKIPGRSQKVRTTRGVIFCQGIERIWSYKSVSKSHKSCFLYAEPGLACPAWFVLWDGGHILTPSLVWHVQSWFFFFGGGHSLRYISPKYSQIVQSGPN